MGRPRIEDKTIRLKYTPKKLNRKETAVLLRGVPIYMYDADTMDYICTFESLVEASEELEVPQTTLTRNTRIKKLVKIGDAIVSRERLH